MSKQEQTQQPRVLSDIASEPKDPLEQLAVELPRGGETLPELPSVKAPERGETPPEEAEP